MLAPLLSSSTPINLIKSPHHVIQERNVRQKRAALEAIQDFEEAISSADDLRDCERVRRELNLHICTMKKLFDEADAKVVGRGGERLGQRDERIRHGQCPDCSLQTHEVVPPVPLTNDYVMGGRCLLCNPAMTVTIASAAASVAGSGSSSSRASAMSSLAVPQEAEQDRSAPLSNEHVLGGRFPLCGPSASAAAEAMAAAADSGSSSSRASVVSPLSVPEDAEPAGSVRFRDNGVWGDYVGDLDSEGRRHGRGKITYENGTFYDGEWESDKRKGRGSRLYKDGFVYDGGFKNNKREGRGVLRFPDGNKHYEGEWENHKAAGRGIAWWGNGNKYEGEWREGKREGEGIYTWKTGSSCTGTWKGDKREGGGIYRYADGCVEICVYKDDKISGQGVRWIANRQAAWLLEEGKVTRKIGLSEAKATASQMGFDSTM